MEPLTVVGLAANIMQFVGTTKKIISSSRQLRSFGSRKEHVELEAISQELQNLVARVNPPDPPEGCTLSDEERSVRALAKQCNEIAQELLKTLEKMKPKYKNTAAGYVDSFYKALLIEWNHEKVAALQNRLEIIGANMSRHLSAYDNGRIIRRLDELAAANRRLDAHRAKEIEELRMHFDTIFKGMKNGLKEEDSRDATIADLVRAAGQGSRFSAEQVILEQLRFQDMNDRQRAIREAHDDTFTWLFGTGEQTSPATFEDWLVSEDKIYWISGKPGSGKSTLMKFLSSEPQTQRHLETWAGEKRLVMSEFYFWSAGKSQLLKSREGLLRSLVYNILRQYPDLIPLTYPRIWRLLGPEANYGSQTTVLPTGPNLLVPISVTELLETIKTISMLPQASEAKYCFFIDGMDEYHGKPDDVITLMHYLCNLPDVKLCLSSRPWNEFEENFGKNSLRKLYMQDFNAQDISAYIHDTFEKDENYQDLDEKDAHGRQLVQEMVYAANGVFLWVFLVVQSFKEGLMNGDRISDLQKRLQELPNDLNEYFEKILLSDVKGFYRQQSAEIFLVSVGAEQSLPLLAYWYMDEDGGEVVGDDDTKQSSLKDIFKRTKILRKRLNASCKGLLEVQDQTVDGKDEALPFSIYFSRKVGFLHRTVRDFLELDQTGRMLRSWCTEGFNPHKTICKMLVTLIKAGPKEMEYWSELGPVRDLTMLCNAHLRHLEFTPDHRSDATKLRRSLLGTSPATRGWLEQYVKQNEGETTVVAEGPAAEVGHPVKIHTMDKIRRFIRTMHKQ